MIVITHVQLEVVNTDQMHAMLSHYPTVSARYDGAGIHGYLYTFTGPTADLAHFVLSYWDLNLDEVGGPTYEVEDITRVPPCTCYVETAWDCPTHGGNRVSSNVVD